MGGKKSSGIKRFVFDTDKMVDISFDIDALKEIKNIAKDGVTLSISRAEATSKDAKTAIGRRPLYDISIIYYKDKKSKNR